MARKLTFSTGFDRTRLRTYRDLMTIHVHPRGRALEEYMTFQRASGIVHRHLGRDLDGLHVLEVGCGQRFTITLLLCSSGARVVAIDTDYVTPHRSAASFVRNWRQNGLERSLKTLARQLLFDGQYYRTVREAFQRPLRFDALDLRVMDACALDLPDDHFDFVYSSSVFEHIYNVDAASREVARVLKPGGIAYIGVHLFPSLCGGHDLEWGHPDTVRPRKAPPWDHLRQNLYPHHAYLNELREADYMASFGRYLTIVDVTSLYSGEKHLTEEIQRELSHYTRDDLLKSTIWVVMRKPQRAEGRS